jgi:single-stranded DNA-specific DHH superfamily exonuclease
MHMMVNGEKVRFMMTPENEGLAQLRASRIARRFLRVDVIEGKQPLSLSRSNAAASIRSKAKIKNNDTVKSLRLNDRSRIGVAPSADASYFLID